VEQARDEDVGSATPSPRSVATTSSPWRPVGDVHGVEERELAVGQPGRQLVALDRRHAAPDVRSELADLASPPGSRR
jgi:hypothetical protein